MIYLVRFKTLIAVLMIVIIAFSIVGVIIKDSGYTSVPVVAEEGEDGEKKWIKWVDFQVPLKAMQKAIDIDIKSQPNEIKIKHYELLAYLAAKYGGNFKRYKTSDMDKLVARLNAGEKLEDITKDMKYFSYFLEAYTAIFAEFVGPYQIQAKDAEGNMVWQPKYGLKVFSPIAKGYSFGHYKDFGDGRNFGYKRKHLGNDLMGSIGTPIIAIESGMVEVAGWNVYGGWRIGIRSFDKKRYYYYAHMRKDRPYAADMYAGKIVKAGDVIGYLGMTGYSTTENKNNIKVPHLHLGLQLIFDESQKEGINQIWIDVYNIVELLRKNRTEIVKDPATKEAMRVYDIKDPTADAFID